jgi:hypothetical protein
MVVLGDEPPGADGGLAAGVQPMTDEVRATLSTVLERWGFPVLVALAAGWILRNDVLLPLVEEHRSFVRQLGETQKEIANAVNEQTRLLYALQPRAGHVPVKAEVRE